MPEENSSSTSAMDNVDSPCSDSSPSDEIYQREVSCVCQDDVRVTVSGSLLRQSGAFADMCKNVEPTHDFTFEVKNIPATIFKKIVDWMKNHVGQPVPEFEEDPNSHERKWFTQTDFEKDFFNIDVEELADFLTASNFLNLQSLYRHACQAMAALLKDKTADEIRELLGLDDDLSDEQKAEIRRKNVWCNY